MLTPLQLAALTVLSAAPHTFSPAALTVMPDHLNSTPTGRAERYAGPSSLPSNRRADYYALLFSLHTKRLH